jgi:hypothetical protein
LGVHSLEGLLVLNTKPQSGEEAARCAFWRGSQRFLKGAPAIAFEEWSCFRCAVFEEFVMAADEGLLP